MSPLGEERHRKGLEEAGGSFWCGLQSAASEMLLQTLLSRCTLDAESNGSHGKAFEICTACEVYGDLQDGDLVLVGGSQRGEVVEVDYSKKDYPLRICTVDGATKWYPQAAVAKLRLTAKEASQLYGQVAAVREDTGAALFGARLPNVAPEEKDAVSPVPDAEGGGFLEETGLRAAELFLEGVEPNSSVSIDWFLTASAPRSAASLADAARRPNLQKAPAGLRETAEALASAAFEALVAAVGDPHLSQVGGGRSFDEDVLRASRVSAALEEMDTYDTLSPARSRFAADEGAAAAEDDEGAAAAEVSAPPQACAAPPSRAAEDPFWECDHWDAKSPRAEEPAGGGEGTALADEHPAAAASEVRERPTAAAVSAESATQVASGAKPLDLEDLLGISDRTPSQMLEDLLGPPECGKSRGPEDLRL